MINWIKKHLILDGLVIAIVGIILFKISQINIFNKVGLILFLVGLGWMGVIMLIQIIKKGFFFGAFQPIFQNRGH